MVLEYHWLSAPQGPSELEVVGVIGVPVFYKLWGLLDFQWLSAQQGPAEAEFVGVPAFSCTKRFLTAKSR